MPLRKIFTGILCFMALQAEVSAQETKILGFADVVTSMPVSSPRTGPVSFSLGEQDLFITSDLSDRISFLGETVFKFNAESGTNFAISVERIVIKYNIKGNHNLLIGKDHTPLNYWNETYHHGRVFFPTIFRPEIFNQYLIPLHTIGARLQGLNLGKLNFGYDVMIGNGLGSTDIKDNNYAKSVTVNLHISPVEGLRIGASYYNDHISKQSMLHDLDKMATENFDQQIASTSIVYFGKKFEAMSEASAVYNYGDSTKTGQATFGAYVYAGYRVAPKVTAYSRYDGIRYAHNDYYFRPETGTLRDRNVFIVGARYEFNYLAVVKLEYQLTNTNVTTHGINAQFAVGF